MDLPDRVLLALYSYWSEDFYAASFLSPDSHSVEEFRRWLEKLKESEPLRDYEQEFLEEYHKQEQTKGGSAA